MIRPLAVLLCFVSQRPVLLATTIALFGSGILLLICGLSPPPTGAAANSPHASAPVAQPISTVTWGTVSSFNEPDFDDIAPAVHPTDPLRALLSGPRPAPKIRYTTDGGATWQLASG